jgi:hypothetical protein
VSDAGRTLTGALHGYRLGDWRVDSELPLPELAPWDGSDRAADLVIRLAPAIASVAGPVLSTAALAVDAHGRARFDVAGVAAFLIEDGCRITIQAHIDPRSPDIRLFLLGTPLGLIYLQRGMVPVHAAGVEIDGEAVLMAGSSRVGKSTLAWAFVRRGFRLISDDVVPLEFAGPGLRVHPGVTRLQLWAEACAALGIGGELERCRAAIEKFSQPVIEGAVPHSLRPAALIHLRRKADSVGGMTLRRIRGRSAANELGVQVYRRRAMCAIAGETPTLAILGRAAAAIPQHYMLSRPLRFDELDRTVDAIVGTVRAAR